MTNPDELNALAGMIWLRPMTAVAHTEFCNRRHEQ